MPRGIRLYLAIFAAIFVLSLAALALTSKDRIIRTELTIDAPPETVWRVLTATADYPSWNPFIVSLKGDLVAGHKLEATARPPGGMEMNFSAIVVEVKPNRELVWRGDLLMPGIFRGVHRFQLEPAAGGRTRFIQSEHFSGLLVGPLTNKMLDQTGQGFTEMNLGVKIQSEQRR